MLACSDVSKSFGGVVGLSNVNLDVQQGSIVGLVGPNGSGKTTLFNVVTGIYPVSSGSIAFLGQRIENRPPHQIARSGIARTFQSIRIFYRLSVLENVLTGYHRRLNVGLIPTLLGLRLNQKAEAEALDTALELLEFVGLVDERDRYASELPYGQQRRLEIARALASEPSLLLLDEPSAGMNADETNHLIELFVELNQRMGKTLFIIEHNMDVVMSISETIYCLDAGRRIACGPPGEIQRDPSVRAAYLGE